MAASYLAQLETIAQQQPKHSDPPVVQNAHGENVPEDFGAPNGMPITNKSTLMCVTILTINSTD